jgi:hypothetical protein
MAAPGGTFTNSPTTFTELVSTTFRKHRKTLVDNMSNRNALWSRLKRKGNIKLEDGGLSIATPLDYAENSTYKRYSDWDLLDVSQSEVISAAEYAWKQISLSVVASGRELRINSGESKIIDLAKARIKNAMRTFANQFSVDLYSAGLLANQIGGLQAIVADAAGSTVGGINSGTYTFWDNQRFDLSDNSVTLGSTTIENSAMLPLWLNLDRGMGDQPDLILMSNAWYAFFEASQTSLKRYSGNDSADGGFVTLKYKGADVLFDGGSGIPVSHAYFLNTEYLYLAVHKDANLEVMDKLHPINQDGSVTPILWMGNLISTNRHQQGVIIA